MCFVHLTAIHPRDGDGRVSDIVQMCHHALKTLLDCEGLVADQNLLIYESRTFAQPEDFDDARRATLTGGHLLWGERTGWTIWPEHEDREVVLCDNITVRAPAKRHGLYQGIYNGMKGIQLEAQSLLYEAFKEFTYSFVDNNEPKLWIGARIWAAPIDADNDLAITKTSSSIVGESVELEDFGAVANVDDDAKSQNSWSTNIEDSPMVEQHSFEQTDRHRKRRSPSD